MNVGIEGEEENKLQSVLSAEKAKKILASDNSLLFKFDLTEKEIKMIQMVIEYNETPEENPGILQKNDYKEYNFYLSTFGKEYKGIKGLQAKYEFSDDDLPKVERLCALLKDADILDRERFSPLDLSLNIAYLHTKSAKDIRMTTFANRLNNAVANEILREYYDQKEELVNAVNKLYERKELESLPKNETLAINQMFSIMRNFGIFLERDQGDNTIIDMLRQQYEEQLITPEDIQMAIDRIKNDFQESHQPKSQSTQKEEVID